jgi:Dolichyl-phosphate-mannose-protein mannosyltransferase
MPRHSPAIDEPVLSHLAFRHCSTDLTSAIAVVFMARKSGSGSRRFGVFDGQDGRVSTTHKADAGRLEAWVIKNSGWLALAIIAVAFALRLGYAGSCYLNPDEGEHFGAARPDSWLGALRAALQLAHPPLFILVLHGTLFLGRSELIIRMPSLIFGTAALGFAFLWIRQILGEISALAGLGFLALAPAGITAATEVRQYGLFLFFVCGALYATERTFGDRSDKWAIIQGIFLLGALLTHYTAAIVLISLGVYVLLRLLSGGMPRRVVAAWIASQCVLATLLGCLYFVQIRRSMVFHSGGGLDYLQHYFYSAARETPLGFTWRALLGTFAYIVNVRALALPFMLLFAAGVAALLARRTKAPSLLALLVVSPFVVGFAIAIFRVFPFAGSRHQTYLLPFLAAGISAALAWVPRGWAVPLLLLGAIVAPLWAIHSRPENDPRVMPIADMTAAIDYIGRTVPQGSTFFTDEMSRDVLRYYLARNDSSLPSSSSAAGVEELLGGYRVVVPGINPVTDFRVPEMVGQVTGSARALGLPSGDPFWVVSVAWKGPPLDARLPAGTDHDSKEFGEISVLRFLPPRF